MKQEEKINIAELLKDCPQGMELDCTMFDNVTFGGISNGRTIVVTRRTVNHKLYLDKYGCPLEHFKGDLKCVIFPKGKTTWEGFVPPCTFKDGDVVTDGAGWIGITSGGEKNQFIPTYCVVKPDGEFEAYLDRKEVWCFHRLATEEEKEKLFQAIKDNGYKWNAETKTLEKLIEPKFKVGDRIHNKTYKDYIYDVLYFTDKGYKTKEINAEYSYHILFEEQDNYELVPNKFDINTLVPFESRVLVRNSDSGFWKPAFWGIYEADKSNEHQYRNYLTTKGFFRHCIPYNDDTKHLLGTTDDCDDFYKTWED